MFISHVFQISTIQTVIGKWINKITALIGILKTETSELQQKVSILRPDTVGRMGVKPKLRDTKKQTPNGLRCLHFEMVFSLIIAKFIT